MEAGKWQSPGIKKEDNMDEHEGMFLKPGKKSVGFGKHEGKASIPSSGPSNPSSGMIDEYSKPGTGKEGHGNKELDQRPQAVSSASGQKGAARFGDPMIHENSTESEIY